MWNHDFLNKKPWHPLNRQNQARIFEAEQEYLDRKKREDTSRAEFEAEQQYLETLAHLPGKEADKYRQMQGTAHCQPRSVNSRCALSLTYLNLTDHLSTS